MDVKHGLAGVAVRVEDRSITTRRQSAFGLSEDHIDICLEAGYRALLDDGCRAGRQRIHVLRR